MDDSQAPDKPSPEPSRPRTVFDGFRRPMAPAQHDDEGQQTKPSQPPKGVVSPAETAEAEEAVPLAVRTPEQRSAPQRRWVARARKAALLAVPITFMVSAGVDLGPGNYLFTVFLVLYPFVAVITFVYVSWSDASRQSDHRTRKKGMSYAAADLLHTTAARAVLDLDDWDDPDSVHYTVVAYGPDALYEVVGQEVGKRFNIDKPDALDPALRGRVRDSAHGLYELQPAPITIDYDRASLRALEVHDAEGALIYRDPDYHPD